MGSAAVAEPGAGQSVRATVAYDGTDFSGFQVQVGQRSVQGVLEEGLATITGEGIRVIGAGRTDSGVHALGQVVAFRTHWQHELAELHRAWNAVLPQDVAICSLEPAAEGFHPRFDAKSRWYRYSIWNHPLRNPLLRRTTLWVSDRLNARLMRKALSLLVGEYDFATFGSPPQGENTVRRVLRAAWVRQGNTLHLDIEANAFLYRMVRGIVGTLLQVGTGALSVAEFGSRFVAADRALGGPAVPPSGLCLMAVRY